MPAKKDWTGQTYFNLTFVRPTDQKRNNNIIWELKCTCGKLYYREAYPIVCGNTKSCGCIGPESWSQNGLSKRKFDPKISSARVVWKQHSYDEISFDDFYQLSQQACVYCGSPPNRTINFSEKSGRSEFQLENGNFIYNGLDRIDSSKSHTLDNVVPCCWTCNSFKKNMTLEDFIKHIDKIYYHLHRL